MKKGILWGLLVFIAGLGLGGLFVRPYTTDPVYAGTAAAAKSVRAEAFELVDQKGIVRAKLQIGADGEPGLVVYDKNQKPAAAYSLNGQGPVQNLLDQILR
ncbi:MAG: hypothetical protein EPO39_11105 [Candidatus Manganitrophaceae bacterium]|nr:MAG: hypothetical protein EPO39_11105 [Candidatus Manganitrophaceae bacterium]